MWNDYVTGLKDRDHCDHRDNLYQSYYRIESLYELISGRIETIRRYKNGLHRWRIVRVE